MMNGEGLTDYAADREAHVKPRGDAERIHHGGDIAREILHAIVASDGIAAAMAAHVDAPGVWTCSDIFSRFRSSSCGEIFSTDVEILEVEMLTPPHRPPLGVPPLGVMPPYCARH